jgi:lysophospholipase L1-like esterase
MNFDYHITRRPPEQRSLFILFDMMKYMNTNPSAIKVLCYGDSNTWGRLPDRSGRYAADVRWPGQLQKALGDNYYVVEEGQGGRTTDLDDRGSVRNGKTYLLPCLETHNPVDVVIIMLGTNDLKIKFERTANNVAQALHGLVDIVKETVTAKGGSPTRIVLVSPIHIDPTAPRFMEFYKNDFSPYSGTSSTLLAEAIKQVAVNSACDFFDASAVASVGEDGLHLNTESNGSLAKALAGLLV